MSKKSEKKTIQPILDPRISLEERKRTARNFLLSNDNFEIPMNETMSEDIDLDIQNVILLLASRSSSEELLPWLKTYTDKRKHPLLRATAARILFECVQQDALRVLCELVLSAESIQHGIEAIDCLHQLYDRAPQEIKHILTKAAKEAKTEEVRAACSQILGEDTEDTVEDDLFEDDTVNNLGISSDESYKMVEKDLQHQIEISLPPDEISPKKPETLFSDSSSRYLLPLFGLSTAIAFVLIIFSFLLFSRYNHKLYELSKVNGELIRELRNTTAYISKISEKNARKALLIKSLNEVEKPFLKEKIHRMEDEMSVRTQRECKPSSTGEGEECHETN